MSHFHITFPGAARTMKGLAEVIIGIAGAHLAYGRRYLSNPYDSREQRFIVNCKIMNSCSTAYSGRHAGTGGRRRMMAPVVLNICINFVLFLDLVLYMEVRGRHTGTAPSTYASCFTKFMLAAGIVSTVKLLITVHLGFRQRQRDVVSPP